MKHTPGPWTQIDDAGKIWIYSNNYDVIAQVDRNVNARLIAAAPDQNAALHNAPVWPITDSVGQFLRDYQKWYEGERAAAIAKAEGRELGG